MYKYQIFHSIDANQLQDVRNLFLEYQQELGHDLCFQNFKLEIDTLPGKYSDPEGHILLIKDEDSFELAGCVALRKYKSRICEMKRLFIRPSFAKKDMPGFW